MSPEKKSFKSIFIFYFIKGHIPLLAKLYLDRFFDSIPERLNPCFRKFASGP